MSHRAQAAVVPAAALVGVAAAALHYAAARVAAERHWLHWAGQRLTDIGEVDGVTVLPLVERVTSGPGLHGEPGLSYLITAGPTRLLFDTGLNLRARAESALVHNAAALGADLAALDAVVISHQHMDHVGGPGRQLRRTFAFSRQPIGPPGIPAYVPADMTHPRARTVTTTAPRVIAPGIAVLPPLPQALFWLGPVHEQALIVNVRGFGLVLVSGCGHPPIERTLAVAERALDVPIQGAIGGFHLPVHPLGTPLIPQAILGSPHPPWRPVDERDAAAVMDAIAQRVPRVVALSGHDSTPGPTASSPAASAAPTGCCAPGKNCASPRQARPQPLALTRRPAGPRPDLAVGSAWTAARMVAGRYLATSQAPVPPILLQQMQPCGERRKWPRYLAPGRRQGAP